MIKSGLITIMTVAAAFRMWDRTLDPHIHPNHSMQSHRELLSSLRSQHLPGVDTDDEALVASTIEQARLLLVTAGGLLGLTLTKMLDIQKPVCAWPIYLEVISLTAALLLGWLGLLAGIKIRGQRVDRRYAILDAHVAVYMRAEKHRRSIDYNSYDQVFDKAFKPERATARTISKLRLMAATLTALGILFAATAAVGTASPDRCFGGSFIGLK